MKVVPKAICCDWCGVKGKGVRVLDNQVGSVPSWFCSDSCMTSAREAAERLKAADSRGKNPWGKRLCRHCGRSVEYNRSAKWCNREVCQAAKKRYNYGNSRRRARAFGKTLRSTRRGKTRLLAPGEKLGRCPKCGALTVNRFLCSTCWSNKQRALDSFMAMGGIEINDGPGMVTGRFSPAELDEIPVPSQELEDV